MGRKRLPLFMRRHRTVIVRFTSSEFEKLMQLKKERKKKTVSEVVRDLI